MPASTPILNDAKARWRAGEHGAAVALLREHCRDRQQDGEAHALLGAFLIETARAAHAGPAARRSAPGQEPLAGYREAVAHLQRAAALLPGAAVPQQRLGIALRELGEFEAAHEAFLAAQGAAPGDAGAAADVAFSLQCLGRGAEAMALWERTLEAHPDDANVHAGFALSLLGAGEFARGWDEYEWRLRVPGGGMERNFPYPSWHGEPLAERTLLVYSEQGIGDEIMFASCFHELIGAAGHCVLESSKRLVPLFERSFRGATILARERSRMPDWSALPPVDLQVAAGSVPRFLRRSAEAFPARAAYLSADPARVAHWRTRLAELGPGPKVGLAWTGGLPGTLRAARSLPLEALRPVVATAGVHCVSLEFLDCAAEVAQFSRAGSADLQWWPEAVSTLDETAALVSALDLVITVTTATAHLAGALGRPTWVLVPNVPTWRYMWQGERMPWYPSVRVLRGAGNATALVARVRDGLEALRS